MTHRSFAFPYIMPSWVAHLPRLVQDIAQETAAIASTFRLPWNAAANWMSQRSPNAKLAPMSYPGRR